MFTGIIGQTGRVARLAPAEGGARLLLRSEIPFFDAVPGESIAVNGVCLTVEPASGAGDLEFFLSNETLDRTTLAGLLPEAPVNLERALRLGDRLGGHLVMGHVDGVGSIESLAPLGEGLILTVRHPRELAPFFAQKGSVAVDGISLTIVDPLEDRFSVAVIPHTIAATTLHEARAGQKVNLEVDVLARYAVRALEAMQEAKAPAKSSLTMQKLIDAGFVDDTGRGA